MNSSADAIDGRFFQGVDSTVARKRYSTLLDTVTDGIYQLDPGMHIVAVNDAFATRTGYPRDELLGEHVSLLLGADGLERLEGEITRQRDSFDPTPVDVAVHTAHHDTVECVVQVSLLTTDGKFRGSLGVVRSGGEAHSSIAEPARDEGPDIDDIIGTTAVSAPASTTVPLNLIEATADAALLLDDSFEIVWASETVGQYLGTDSAELIGQGYRTVVQDRLKDIVEDPKRIEDRLLAPCDDESRAEEFLVHVTPGTDREERWLEHRSKPITSGQCAGGRIEWYTDISDRKRSADALKESEEEFHSLIDAVTAYKQFMSEILNAIDDLFYVVNREGKFHRWNKSIRTVTGYSDEEIEAMGPLEFIVEEDREQIADGIEEIFETGSARVEAAIRTKHGQQVPIEFSASMVETPNNEPMIAGIGRDITERKRRQRQLEASNKRLEEFAYAASHDLQEPLRMVSSYLQLIKTRYEDVLDEEGVEFLEFAVDGADRMREMIDSLLAYSRIESEGDPFEPVELDDVVATVLDDLRILCSEHRAKIAVAPLPCVEGDRGQLRQLFQNLIKNALENSGDAVARIHIGAERDDDRWLLSVRDEGVGIDPSDSDRIFDVFQSLDGPDEQNSGIGLALCERIVKRHGGDIWIDSTLGDGATFSFTLPAAGANDG